VGRSSRDRGVLTNELERLLDPVPQLELGEPPDGTANFIPEIGLTRPIPKAIIFEKLLILFIMFFLIFRY
jgi:hypothetical protein